MTAFLNTNPTPRKKNAHPFSSLERSKKVAASTTRVLLLRVAVGVFLRRLVLLLRQKSVDAAHVSTAKTTLFDEMCLLFRLLLMTTTLCATKKYTTWETNLEKVSINLDKGARETTLFVFFFSKSLAWMEKKYGAAPFSFLSGVSCVSLSFFCVLGRRTDKKDKKDEKKDQKNKKKQRKKEKKKSTRISTAQKKNYYYFRFVSSSSSSHSSSQKKRGEESGRRSEKRKTHTHTERERERTINKKR